MGSSRALLGLCCLAWYLVGNLSNVKDLVEVGTGSGGGVLQDHDSYNGTLVLYFLGASLLGATFVSILLFWICLSAKTRTAVEGDIWGNMKLQQVKEYDTRNLIPVACTILAALILHAPGLYCRVLYRHNCMEVVGALLGSTTEGVFLLLLYTKAILVAQQLYHSVVQRCRGMPGQARRRGIKVGSRQHRGGSSAMTVCPLLLEGTILLVLVLATVLLVAFSVASSIGDYTFQSFTSGVIPDMWALAAGYKEAQAQIQVFKTGGKEAVATAFLVVTCFVSSFVLYAWGQCQHGMHQQEQPNTTAKAGVSVGSRSLLTLMLLALSTYQLGLWQPVMHATLSLFGSFIFTPPGQGQQIQEINMASSSSYNSTRTAKQDQPKRPNVIYIVHESLSGAYWLNRPEARPHTPFFDSLSKNDNFYVFPHARATSGDTADAFTALATGCLPIDDLGRNLAFENSIGTEFKRQGYNTASFSVRSLGGLIGSRWFMIHNYLTGNMNYLVDADSEHVTGTHGPAGDDRYFAQRFAEWSSNQTTTDPFFAQFYMFNSHIPFLPKDIKSSAKGLSRYYESFGSIDEALQIVFDHLNQTGKLNNTIVIGSGDHGETPEGKRMYGRLWNWNPYVLQPLTYMYIPQEFSSKVERDTLRSNTQKVVSTLDLFPTLLHFTKPGNSTPTLESDNCISGMDLLKASVPSDRATMSWNSKTMSAISTKDRSLYATGDKGKLTLKELAFGNCTSTPNPAHNCVHEPTEADLDHWRRVVAKLGNNTNNAGRNACFMEAILDKLKMPSFQSM